MWCSLGKKRSVIFQAYDHHKASFLAALHELFGHCMNCLGTLDTFGHDFGMTSPPRLLAPPRLLVMLPEVLAIPQRQAPLAALLRWYLVSAWLRGI